MVMEIRTLGRTGIKVGVIGLGTEHLPADRKNMDAVLDVAVSGEVNYIDLFTDPSFGTFADYIDAIEPGVQRHREHLVLCLHWGAVYHEPIDQCQLAFDQALERLGNNYAEIAMISMVDSRLLWEGWAQPAIRRVRHYLRPALLTR